MIYKILIIGHVMGDFYVQSDKMADEKKSNIAMLIRHCLIYVLSILATGMSVVIKEEWIKFMILLLVVGVLHIVIDYIKIRIENVIDNKSHVLAFVADQLIHITILIGTSKLLGLSGGPYSIFFGEYYYIGNYNHIIMIILGILICIKPASVFVGKVINSLKETSSNEEGDVRAGALIGILERLIVFVLGIMGQFGAIGFVIAAKSLARYKQLEDKSFAEKYIVGTLLSALIAILCSIIV